MMESAQPEIDTESRVGAATAIRVEDYLQQGQGWWLRLHEKGGKGHAVPTHHNAKAYLDACVEASGLRWVLNKRRPLFQTLNREKRLTGDRDAIYGTDVRVRIASLGVEKVLTALQSPWQNP
jgi:hypothetical protein